MTGDWQSLADFDPRDKATIIRDHAPDDFARFVAEETDLSRYGLLHALLASLPTTEHVTTNFDVLFEKAASTAGRRVAVIPGEEARFGERWLLKLHGTLDVGYYFAIGMFQQENATQWLSKHPNFMNATWSEITETTAQEFLQESLESDDVPEFTQKNLDHYLRIRRYVFWTYQQIIRELSEGKPLQEIYLEFIDTVNLLDLPKDLHHQLANEAVSLASDFTFEN